MTGKNSHQPESKLENVQESTASGKGHKPEGAPSEVEVPAKQDPTNRWSERVRAMSSGRHHKSYVTRGALSDETQRCCPLRLDVQALADTAEECIAKRPLTSMVIAATAGAAVTALFAALVGSSRRHRR